MKNELLNLLILTAVSLFYLTATIKVMLSFFYSISKPLTNASALLLTGVVFGFGLSLYHFSEIGSNALYFYANKNQTFTGIFFWVVFAALAFAFSFAAFHLSYRIIGFVTQENEKAELSKNNFYLAGLHAVVFILVCMIVAKPLTDLANTFVSYPRFPN
jgi:hypothetical protein